MNISINFHSIWIEKGIVDISRYWCDNPSWNKYTLLLRHWMKLHRDITGWLCIYYWTWSRHLDKHIWCLFILQLGEKKLDINNWHIALSNHSICNCYYKCIQSFMNSKLNLQDMKHSLFQLLYSFICIHMYFNLNSIFTFKNSHSHTLH